MVRARTSLAFALVAAVLLAPAAARAQKSRSDGAKERAASVLFYDGRALMQRGQFAAACAKFEESLRLDRGIGTEFNLADCNERIGKIATAWAGFESVAAATKARGQLERERTARVRAKALEPKLPRLVIVVASPEPGMEVRLDGQLVERAQWGTAVPVDPGMRELAATAPGHTPYLRSVSAVRGVTERVQLPPLSSPRATVPDPVASGPVSTTTVTFGELPAPAERSTSQRTLGYVIGGAGIASLGVAGYFGLDSLAKADRAKGHCTGDLCDAEGVGLRDDAIRSGRAATIATFVGGIAVTTGILLLVIAPTNEPKERSVAVTPLVGAGAGGVVLQGSLP